MTVSRFDERPAQEAPAVLEWIDEGIARITFTRGDSHNTVTFEFLDTVDRLLREVSARKARVLILTGSGRTFCGGAQITYFTDPQSPLYRNARAIRDDYVVAILNVFSKVRDASCVTIASINGFALGGGCELALSCDFRLMADHTRMGLTETRIGALAAAGGVQLLARVVGRAKALEIALLGEQLSARDAQAAGLVTSLYPADQLAAATEAFARRFLVCSPISIAETKRALYRCETVGGQEADQIALDAVASAAAGAEWWEGMAAFTEKRNPSFRAGD
ncbi:Short chain enoyl-CoA hydratase [Mesorhizobium plurifarium]|uniref:Short chain enoyl-CoA hydratase n=1 Tax=Mesorhizobium plurifarium TaxID=69974 RepID=A0A0K2W1F6_MESPL|nr:Short chain enoyl-CoA hydratase [Mesorhizobium plurifarium]